MFVAPLLIDQEAVDVLVQYVCDCLTGSCDFMDSYNAPSEAGMGLLVVCNYSLIFVLTFYLLTHQRVAVHIIYQAVGFCYIASHLMFLPGCSV